MSLGIQQPPPRLHRPQHQPLIDHSHLGGQVVDPVENLTDVDDPVHLLHHHQIRRADGGQRDPRLWAAADLGADLALIRLGTPLPVLRHPSAVATP
jgi:hypothetical protein